MDIKPFQFTTGRMVYATMWLAISLTLFSVGSRTTIFPPDGNYPLAFHLLFGALATFCVSVAALCGRTYIGVWIAFVVLLFGPALVFLNF
jgi:hypothetical protein